MGVIARGIGLLILVALAAVFNFGIIDVRFDEIRFLIGKITVDQDLTKTFDILAKYELIRRRMLFGESDMQNYELEARIAALTSGEEDRQAAPSTLTTILRIPAYGVLNTLRFLLGKEFLNPKEDDQIVNVVQLGYFWERNRTYTEAIKIYTKVLSMPGVSAELKSAILVHMGFCHSMMSEYDVSKDLYEQVITLYPSTQAGMLAWKLLDFIQNMEKERAALQDQGISDFEKARQFYRFMDYRNSIKYFSLTLGKPIKDTLEWESRFYKGRSHEEVGETQEALAEYNYIIKNYGESEWARQSNRRILMLGEFYDQKKQLADEARKQLARYRDESFGASIKQYASLMTQSSLKRELGGETKGSASKSGGDDSLLAMINKIGAMDLTGEKAALQEQERQSRIDEMRQQMISRGNSAEIHELERMEALKENPSRRPLSIKQVIDGNVSQLKYLYNKRLRSGQKLVGRMDVEMKIGSSGKIDGVRILQSTIGDPAFEQDVTRAIASWSFNAVPDSLGTMTVNYPFDFNEDE